MAEVHIKDMDEHEIDTILAEDIDFEGHLTFKKPLMIKGKFKGEIKVRFSVSRSRSEFRGGCAEWFRLCKVWE